MASSQITSVDDLIAKLGGTNQAARTFKTTPQNVSNWKAAKKLPTDKYLEHRKLFSGLGIVTADSLWFAAERARA